MHLAHAIAGALANEPLTQSLIHAWRVAAWWQAALILSLPVIVLLGLALIVRDTVRLLREERRVWKRDSEGYQLERLRRIMQNGANELKRREERRR